MLKPIDRAMVSNQVFDQLRDEILSKEYSPGDRLPPERELSDIFKVNRSSVREALKRLEQARLIEIQQGGGSTVLDFSLHGGFDLIPWLVTPGGKGDPLAMRSVLEFRLIINPEIARFTAERILDPELEQLGRIVDEIEACGEEEVDRFQELDFMFIYAMARSSGNLTFILLYNSLKVIYHRSRGFFTEIYRETIKRKGDYRKTYDALCDHDGESAYRHYRELTEYGNSIFWKSMGKGRSGERGAGGRRRGR